MALPQGFEGQVRPRSGLAARHGVTVLNSPGTIDADYRGEVRILLINHGQAPFVVNRGERIAQLVEENARKDASHKEALAAKDREFGVERAKMLEAVSLLKHKQTELERLARQFCRGSATVNGDDTIRSGTMVTFSGLPEGQNGQVYVMATRHIVSSRSGYTTEFTFCSNTMGS